MCTALLSAGISAAAGACGQADLALFPMFCLNAVFLSCFLEWRGIISGCRGAGFMLFVWPPFWSIP